MNVEIQDVSVWKRAVTAVSCLVDEASMEITKEGIQVKSMDLDQISMVSLKLPDTCFRKYEVGDVKTIGVDFKTIEKINGKSTSDNKLEITLEKKLGLKYTGDLIRNYNLSILDNQYMMSRTPKIEYQDSAAIIGNVIKNALQSIELVSNIVQITLTPENIILATVGDKGDVKIVIPNSQLMYNKAKNTVTATYAIDKIKDLLKAADAQSIVHIKLGQNSLAYINYSIGEGDVTYYLAPRVETQ